MSVCLCVCVSVYEFAYKLVSLSVSVSRICVYLQAHLRVYLQAHLYHASVSICRLICKRARGSIHCVSGIESSQWRARGQRYWSHLSIQSTGKSCSFCCLLHNVVFRFGSRMVRIRVE